jgi:Uma2 family endonuclease
MSFDVSSMPLPARVHPEQPLTDDELIEFCRRNDSLRIERAENGDLILMSPAGPEGDAINSELITELKNWTREDGRGKSFGDNAAFRLPDGSMRSPDAAWMPLEHWNALTPDQQKRLGDFVPSFIIELRSESDSLPILREKMQSWLANGVELAWLVDPQRRAVEVYRAGDTPEIYENPTSVQGTGCVSGFCLVLERGWGRE